MPGLGEGDGEGQADVAEPDDPDLHRRSIGAVGHATASCPTLVGMDSSGIESTLRVRCQPGSAQGLRGSLRARADAGGDGPGRRGERLRGDHRRRRGRGRRGQPRDLREMFVGKAGLLPRGLRRGHRRPRRPRLDRLREHRRTALAGPDRRRPAGPGRAARDRARHRPHGDGRGDRRRRGRADPLPGGAGALHLLPRGRPHRRRAGRRTAGRHRPLRDRRRHLDDLRRGPRRAAGRNCGGSCPTWSSRC